MRHAVITGGTGGLGSAIASMFRGLGWSVDAPGSAELEMRDPEGIDAYFKGRPVDLLVCSAGITRDELLVRQTPEAWDEVMAVNFTGARKCAGAVLPGMISRGSGHIVFISSFSAVHPPAGQAAYAASKAALLGLAADLAAAHGTAGIRVNTILPGFLETPMTAGIAPERRTDVLADHHLGRFNTSGAVAAFIRCLHDDLPHTSGQIFQLDSRRSGLP